MQNNANYDMIVVNNERRIVMKDFWDDMGGVYDPLDLFDFDGDGEHDFLETMTAVDAYESGSDDGFDDGFGESFDDGFGDEAEGEDALNGDDFTEDAMSDDDREDCYVARKRDEEEELINYFKVLPFKSEKSREQKIDAVESLFYWIERADGIDDQGVNIKRCLFILQNDCVAADYLDIYFGFNSALHRAIFDSGLLPADFKENYGDDQTTFGLLIDCLDMSPKLFFDVWDWVMKEFAPYEQYDPKFIGDMIKQPFFLCERGTTDAERQYFDSLLQYFSGEPEMLDMAISMMKESTFGLPYLLHYALTNGHKEFVGRVIELLLSQKTMPAKEKTGAMKVLIEKCCQNEDIGRDEIEFLLRFMPEFKQSHNFLILRESPKWETTLREKLEDLE